MNRVSCCADAPHICPGCRRVMSHREWDEQRCCNECLESQVPASPTFYNALSPQAQALIDQIMDDQADDDQRRRSEAPQ